MRRPPARPRSRGFFERHPVVGLTLATAVFVGILVQTGRVETRLPPHGAAQVLALAAGVAAFPALILVGANLQRRAPSAAGLLLFAVACAFLVVFGFYWGLGWHRYGGDVNPGSFPGSLHAFGAGICFGLTVGALALFALALFRTTARRR